MKKLFLSSALLAASLIIPSSVKAQDGPGQSLGNTVNSCSTSSGSCPITPTKFSTKIYRVALCTSNPMETAAAEAGLPVDWDSNGCVDVYNSEGGEDTGDIFSDTGTTLSAENITIPSEGEYSYVAALFDKEFKVASHHQVYNAGDDTIPPLGERYYSTSDGGAAVGPAESAELIAGSFETFMPQIACENGSALADRSATTEGFGDFLAAGETFYGRILKADFTLPTTGSGSIENETAVCDGATYLLSVVNKTTVVGSDTTGIHIKILAPMGLIRADQGDAGDGVITGFTAHGDQMAVKVVPIAASE
ncbi:hypothetical protein [Prochlorococcus marinus]|uniref:hypothetical protein n=1 Tax=Prochlorococcus marinus TaxID=1219 RepID=UPI0039B4975D